MRHWQIVSLLLTVGVIEANSVAEAADLNMAFMSCSKGDRIEITLDSNIVEWVSSDDKIAYIEDGIVIVNDEGQCELINKAKGFKIKLRSSGESEDSSILKVNYSTYTDGEDAVLIKDKTVGIKTVEVNSTVSTDDSSIPVNFSKVEDEGNSVNTNEKIVSTKDVDTVNVTDTVDVKAEMKGNYISESASGHSDIVKVVSPELNQYAFKGSVGQTTEVLVTNLDTDVTYSSSDTSVATVDNFGNVALVGGGEATITVNTGNNSKECKIESVIPVVDTSEITLQENQTYQIEVRDNYANLPVRYSTVSGEGFVSDTGEVSLTGDELTVDVVIGGRYTYTKKFVLSKVNDGYWEAMQPAIEECLGTPYVWGGETPGSGLDCSGYVSYVYKSVGLMSGRDTAQGIYDSCMKTDNPMPGDLVFFKGTYATDDYITHIGIYAGNNEMYHNGNPNQKVSLNTSYWQSHLVGFGTMITQDMQYNDYSGNYTTGDNTDTGYSQKELELIWAIVGQECSTDYDGALAVISSAMNRADVNYCNHGTDVLSQLTAPSQYCYSPDVSPSYLWQNRLNGNVADFVKQAVEDCLVNGKRNHNFYSFRGYVVDGAVNIGDNWYFND